MFSLCISTIAISPLVDVSDEVEVEKNQTRRSLAQCWQGLHKEGFLLLSQRLILKCLLYDFITQIKS